MSDIFDTRFEGKDVELDDNRINAGEDVNLMAKDPTVKRIVIGAGWDLNSFNSDALDADLSVFLLNKEHMTRGDDDFVFYNQPKALDGGVLHKGDNRSGAGDGDDEQIVIDLQSVPFDVLQIAVCLTIYKGYEKQQNLGMLRNVYVRIMNAENHFEICRYVLTDILEDKEETGLIVGFLNREGPKWHFKASDEVVPMGLGELARRYGMIINQE
ncbi:MAG: TerD family protein [Alphaproteobacteria bacterium]|nr:TerD family protein [Alphaproteobacteria bacterium]